MSVAASGQAPVRGRGVRLRPLGPDDQAQWAHPAGLGRREREWQREREQHRGGQRDRQWERQRDRERDRPGAGQAAGRAARHGTGRPSWTRPPGRPPHDVHRLHTRRRNPGAATAQEPREAPPLSRRPPAGGPELFALAGTLDDGVRWPG